MPRITLLKPVKDELAERLKSCFSPEVIEIVPSKSGGTEAKVKNPRYDSCSRNVERHEDLKDCVLLEREPDHFICKYNSNLLLVSNLIKLLKMSKYFNLFKTFSYYRVSRRAHIFRAFLRSRKSSERKMQDIHRRA